jgi:hypothetical protein
MPNEFNTPDPELTGIESALRSLAPTPVQIDRDRIMFRAGQASVQRRWNTQQLWPTIAVGLALVALGEGVFLTRRPSQSRRVVERIAVVREPAPSALSGSPEREISPSRDVELDQDPVSLGQTNYQRLAGQVLRYGLDGLPASPQGGLPSAERWPSSSDRLSKDDISNLLNMGDPS